MLNFYQTQLEDLNISSYPDEVQEQFYDFINNVPYIRNLISENRPYAKDLPRDEEGKIIIDLTNPPILSDMDYFRPSALHYQKHGCYTFLRPNPNPNSEFGKWLRQEVYRSWYGYIREEDGLWIPGDYYFFLNYCPIQLIKHINGKANRVIDFPNIIDGQLFRSWYLYLSRNHGHHSGELAKRGAGKAHPYDQLVYTPEGKKLWGDIKIGDFLFGDDGQLTRVIDIPFDEETDIYEITLANEEKIQCSGGHLWNVKSHSRGDIVIPTTELIRIFKRKRKIGPHLPKGVEYDCTIRVNKGAEFPYQPTKIDPYTFGLLLGDGCFRVPNCVTKTYFTAADNDFETYKNLIPYNWIKYTNTKFGYNLNIPNFGEILKEYGLYYVKSEDKFIPDEYKFNSRAVRINLLKGILDADGTVSKGKIELVLSSKRMIEDVRWICLSLGINVTAVRAKNTWYYDKDRNRVPCLTAYRLSIYSDIPLFNLKRKLDLWEKRSMTGYGRSKYIGSKIIDIQYIGKKQAKCVTVDNESHCYLIGNFITTHNSYYNAATLAKRFLLGESKDVRKKVQCVVTANERKYIQGANQLLDMFQYYIDFLANNTQFPRRRITNSLQNLQWTSGYVDVDTGTRRGSQNSVIGITSKDDSEKLRGSRGVLYLLEEAGTFSHLLELFNTIRPSVEDGDSVFGQIVFYGTSGSDESDFSSMQELAYNPEGYNVEKIPNVYDKEGQGRPYFIYFFPGYLGRDGNYDANGNSNVTKSLLSILADRYKVKYNSTDINSITRRIAEIPITPQEAILRTRGNIFPVTQLTERLNQLDANPNVYDDVFVGTLVFNSQNRVEFKPTSDMPIRDFPLKDNKVSGALEIFKMPEKDREGNIFNNRYIASVDPFDDDESFTMSLYSMFVLDLFTDTIVAEYTGRLPFADDNFELSRKLALFYNAKILYENNRKGLYAYFQRLNSLHLLADTPDYLKDKDLVKYTGIGNKSKGVAATLPINNYGNSLIRDWLLKPYEYIEMIDGEEVKQSIPNLYRLRNRALLKELILFNPDINVDRIRSLAMLMIYREEKMIQFQGDLKRDRNYVPQNYEGNDPFFSRNFKPSKAVNLYNKSRFTY